MPFSYARWRMVVAKLASHFEVTPSAMCPVLGIESAVTVVFLFYHRKVLAVRLFVFVVKTAYVIVVSPGGVLCQRRAIMGAGLTTLTCSIGRCRGRGVLWGFGKEGEVGGRRLIRLPLVRLF